MSFLADTKISDLVQQLGECYNIPVEHIRCVKPFTWQLKCPEEIHQLKWPESSDSDGTITSKFRFFTTGGCLVFKDNRKKEKERKTQAIVYGSGGGERRPEVGIKILTLGEIKKRDADNAAKSQPKDETKDTTTSTTTTAATTTTAE